MAFRLPKLTWGSKRADAPQSFNRFFDLPAELRVKVYEIYLGDGDLVLGCENQPALVRASKRLCKEVQPMFRDQHAFAADMTVWLLLLANSLDINVEMQDLLSNTVRERLSRFRYLQFTITINTLPRRRFRVTVDLSKPGEEYCAFRIQMLKEARGPAVFYKAGVEMALYNMIKTTRPQQDGWLGCIDVMRGAERMLNRVFADRQEWERIASSMVVKNND